MKKFLFVALALLTLGSSRAGKAESFTITSSCPPV